MKRSLVRACRAVKQIHTSRLPPACTSKSPCLAHSTWDCMPKAVLVLLSKLHVLVIPDVFAIGFPYVSMAARLRDQTKIRSPVAEALKVTSSTASTKLPKNYPHHMDADMAILNDLGIETEAVYHNARPGTLYDEAPGHATGKQCGLALRYEKGSAILSTGALAAFSGAKTGRSPLDKRVVEEQNLLIGEVEGSGALGRRFND
eukprot:Skav235277  [mRNA]  locus=scaffold874:339937:341783:+ [translate_table: standard]